MLELVEVLDESGGELEDALVEIKGERSNGF